MKVPVIRQLASTYTVDQLRAAEAAMMDGNPPGIPVDGKDEGEQLTHILSAIEVLELMQTKNVPLPAALREYMERVRDILESDSNA